MMFTHLAIDLADWTNGEWSDFYGFCMRFRNLPCSVMLAADAIAADHGLTQSEDVFVRSVAPVELPFTVPVTLSTDFPADGVRDTAGFTA